MVSMTEDPMFQWWKNQYQNSGTYNLSFNSYKLSPPVFPTNFNTVHDGNNLLLGAARNRNHSYQKQCNQALSFGEHGTSCREESDFTGPHHIRNKPSKNHLLPMLNINMLLKEGKLKQLTNILKEKDICILALQETRYLDKNLMESDGFRIYKGKPAIKKTNSNIVKRSEKIGTLVSPSSTSPHKQRGSCFFHWLWK